MDSAIKMTSKNDRNRSAAEESLTVACSYVSSSRRVVPSPEYIDNIMEENRLAKNQVAGDRFDQITERGNLEGIWSLKIASTTSLKKIQRRRRQKAVGEIINFSGSIEDIVEAMRNNPDSSCIQKKGCRALCELSYHNVQNQGT